jgi:hypothetical protein
MAYTQLIPRSTKDARVQEISRASAHYLLSISSGNAQQYRLAQLDDYTKLNRKEFPLRFPISLHLSARVSHPSIPGTWGFGLWNNPFGLSLGFGGSPWGLPALPNAVWFFGASEESYLSFRKPRPASARRDIAANGFLAQVFRAPKFHPAVILAGFALPFSRRLTRRLLGRIIDEDGINLRRDEQLLVSMDWHRYRLDWREDGVSFTVDDSPVFESPVSPRAPLGVVIWIDNQYAAFTPEGKIGFGVLENPEPAWLEVKDIELS